MWTSHHHGFCFQVKFTDSSGDSNNKNRSCVTIQKELLDLKKKKSPATKMMPTPCESHVQKIKASTLIPTQVKSSTILAYGRLLTQEPQYVSILQADFPDQSHVLIYSQADLLTAVNSLTAKSGTERRLEGGGGGGDRKTIAAWRQQLPLYSCLKNRTVQERSKSQSAVFSHLKPVHVSAPCIYVTRCG